MEFILVKSIDGTTIPILAQVVGVGAWISVEGDGGCRLNSQDAYLVSIVNAGRTKDTRERLSAAGEFVVDQATEETLGELKKVAEQEVLPAVLRAMSLKRMAAFVFYGAKLIASLPADVLFGVMGDPTDIGDERWRTYRQPLPNGQTALIRWFGDPKP